jgi:hypothetical protein
MAVTIYVEIRITTIKSDKESVFAGAPSVGRQRPALIEQTKGLRKDFKNE